MSERLLPHHSHQHTTEDQLWHLRLFFARLYAIALLLSILSSVIIAILTKNPLPGVIPAPLLLSMRPIIRWVFSQSPEMSQAKPARNKTKKYARNWMLNLMLFHRQAENLLLNLKPPGLQD